MNRKTLLLGFLGLMVILGAALFVLQRQSSTIRVERVVNAPVEKVWKLWTDADAIQKWWSPKEFTAPVIKHDFKVGGAFLFSMKGPDGKLFWNTGKYTQIVPYEKIVSDFSFSDENGNVVPASYYKIPGKWPDAVTVNVEFKQQDQKTQIIVQEVGIPMLMYLMAKMGWEQQFDKFEKLLTE